MIAAGVRRWACLGLAFAALLLETSSVIARSAPEKGEPDRVTVGVFLSGLHRLDFVEGSFAADFWVWTNNDAGRVAPIETLDIVNEISKRGEEISSKIVDGRRWEQRRIHGVLQTRWNTWHFPFDRQTIKIILEESFATTDDVIYVADQGNSGVDPAIVVPGWRVLGWRIEAAEHAYPTNFGNLDQRAGSRSPRIVFTLDVQRDDAWLFLNLALGALVAFAMLALSFRMNPTLPPTFAGRMGVIAASVFTVVISMRSTQSFVGHEFGATLVDRIHLLTLLAGFIAAVGAAIARYLSETNCEPQALRMDRRFLTPFTIVYVISVGAMIAASLTGFHFAFM